MAFSDLISSLFIFLTLNMKVALVQFTPWIEPLFFSFNQEDLKIGSMVVAPSEFGLDAGQVIAIKEAAADDLADQDEVLAIDHLINHEDQKIISTHAQDKEKAMNYCRQLAKRHKLIMKLIDCHFSLDGQWLIFAFIAGGRVDFRCILKDLTKYFNRSIRLHQLGVRDEVKVTGDVGGCGMNLCCRVHLNKLGNVNAELAEQQQVAHRGSERLSGICGRLKCCLAFEKEVYDELARKMPAIGTRVRTDYGRGEVIGWQILKGSVRVRLDAEKDNERGEIVEVPIKSN